MKWTHFGVLSTTVGLHYYIILKNIVNCWIIYNYIVGRHHSTTLYIKRF